jgi:hypothetical protein
MEVDMFANVPEVLVRSHRRTGLGFSRSLVAASAALIAIGSPLLSADVSAAQPGTQQQILHYFSKFESQVFLTAAGKPFTPSEKNQVVPGDSIEGTDLDYVGNHLQHAPDWTASDHEVCVLDKGGNPVCQGQIAIGGSMILVQANLGHVSASTSQDTLQVTGGTGTFRGAVGAVVTVQIDPSSRTSDSDVTITLQRP